MKLFKLPQAKGFTLIELLIVIALLGALAIGLLATIDPFEQLKKGRDTSARNTTSEFYNANLRYYATKGEFPWTTSTFVATSLVAMQPEISSLVSAGELKTKFTDLAGSANLAKIFVTSTTSDQVAVCFKPESKSFQEDPATIFGSDGGTSAGTCKALTDPNTNAVDCYFCVQ